MGLTHGESLLVITGDAPESNSGRFLGVVHSLGGVGVLPGQEGGAGE
jgi:hypothetical protein